MIRDLPQGLDSCPNGTDGVTFFGAGKKCLQIGTRVRFGSYDGDAGGETGEKW